MFFWVLLASREGIWTAYLIAQTIGIDLMCIFLVVLFFGTHEFKPTTMARLVATMALVTVRGIEDLAAISAVVWHKAEKVFHTSINEFHLQFRVTDFELCN